MTDELSQILADMKTSISQLEGRVQRLEKRNDERITQDLYEGNKRGIERLGRIFKIDDSKHYDPMELGGMLADYPGSKNSVEMVRAIRDGTWDEDDDDGG